MNRLVKEQLWMMTVIILVLSKVSSTQNISTTNATQLNSSCRPLTSPDLNNLFVIIENQSQSLIDRLAEAVKIPSVSSDPKHKIDLYRMINWTQKILREDLGFETTIVEGKIDPTNPSTKGPNVAPFLLATSPHKTNSEGPTLLIYGHLDVVAASKSDGWDMANPFVMEEVNNFLYGRGATDDKGPVVAWLNALLVLKQAGFCLPLKLKFFFEAMEESGSKGCQDILNRNSSHASFFSDIDWAVVTDNYWLKPDAPTLTYGLRGLIYFYLEISGTAKSDLHSGVYGGTVAEPMSELMVILASLVDSRGHILIPGIYDDVAPFTDEEKKAYNSIDFDVKQYYSDFGGAQLNVSKNGALKKTKIDVLAARWRQPSLSIHGIQGTDKKSVIPNKVIGKFSIRLVPFQDPIKVQKLVTDHVMAVHSNWSNGETYVTVILAESGAEAWYTEPRGNLNFAAAERAIQFVYGKRPDYTREGGSIPAVVYLSRILPVRDSIILMPISSIQDGAHSQNEKISRAHFINGTKLMLTYLYQLSLTGTNPAQRLWSSHTN